jgi:hypothetical protein
MGLTANSKINSDAKRLCCFVAVTELVGSEVVRLFEVVDLVLNVVWCFDVVSFHVRDLNTTPDFDALVLRLCIVVCVKTRWSLDLPDGDELLAICDAHTGNGRSAAVLVLVAE